MNVDLITENRKRILRCRFMFQVSMATALEFNASQCPVSLSLTRSLALYLCFKLIFVGEVNINVSCFHSDIVICICLLNSLAVVRLDLWGIMVQVHILTVNDCLDSVRKISVIAHKSLSGRPFISALFTEIFRFIQICTSTSNPVFVGSVLSATNLLI